MSEITNPFDPNFGKVPKIYLGRQKIVEDIEKLDITVSDIRKYGRVILIFLNRKG